jgi:hypothetical protein
MTNSSLPYSFLPKALSDNHIRGDSLSTDCSTSRQLTWSKSTAMTAAATSHRSPRSGPPAAMIFCCILILLTHSTTLSVQDCPTYLISVPSHRSPGQSTSPTNAAVYFVTWKVYEDLSSSSGSRSPLSAPNGERLALEWQLISS